uniref:Uncharacterized protein n=1 Tax=Ectopseudomonas oleovorans TaxID=301 RepID=A0A653AZI7_ECTOL
MPSLEWRAAVSFRFAWQRIASRRQRAADAGLEAP